MVWQKRKELDFEQVLALIEQVLALILYCGFRLKKPDIQNPHGRGPGQPALGHDA